jgi:hypothetical protein
MFIDGASREVEGTRKTECTRSFAGIARKPVVNVLKAFFIPAIIGEIPMEVSGIYSLRATSTP